MQFYLEMREERRPAISVLYMRRVGAYGEQNAVLMERFKGWLREQHLYQDDTVILAVPLDNPNVTAAENCRYDVCIPDTADRRVDSDEIHSRLLAGGRYVTFLLEHTAQAVQKAWEGCFLEVAQQGYSLDSARPVVERYAKALVDQHRCELCVPVL
ncbi:MAG: DNA gyrase inhibitor [Anaerotruncus sp.]|nr:DNA gyrase inhibitor [Anaerotruncus sp.]